MPKIYNAPPGFEMNPAAGMAQECKDLRALLGHIADIAHCSGLAGHDELAALEAIRRLTLAAWDQSGSVDEHRERVRRAVSEAARRSAA